MSTKEDVLRYISNCSTLESSAKILLDEIKDPCIGMSFAVHCIPHRILHRLGISVKSILSPSLTEPHGGSDISKINTIAEFLGGKDVVVEGEKVFSTNAMYCDQFLVLAKTEKGPVLVLVDRKADGVHIEPMNIGAYKCTGIGRVRYSGSKGRVIVGPGKEAYKLLLSALAESRVLVAAHALGLSKQLLEYIIRWSLARGVWQHQAVRHKIASTYAFYTVARSFVEEVAKTVDRQVKIDWSLTSIAKYFALEASIKAVESAVRVLGGYSVSLDSPLQTIAPHIYALTAAEGTQDIQLEIIARSLEKEYGPLQ